MCIKPEQDLSLLYSQGNPHGCSRLSRRQHPSNHTITVGQNKSQHHPVLQPHHALGGWLCRHGDTGHQLSNLAQTRMLTAGFCFGFLLGFFGLVWFLLWLLITLPAPHCPQATRSPPRTRPTHKYSAPDHFFPAGQLITSTHNSLVTRHQLLNPQRPRSALT